MLSLILNLFPGTIAALGPAMVVGTDAVKAKVKATDVHVHEG